MLVLEGAEEKEEDEEDEEVDVVFCSRTLPAAGSGAASPPMAPNRQTPCIAAGCKVAAAGAAAAAAGAIPTPAAPARVPPRDGEVGEKEKDLDRCDTSTGRNDDAGPKDDDEVPAETAAVGGGAVKPYESSGKRFMAKHAYCPWFSTRYLTRNSLAMIPPSLPTVSVTMDMVVVPFVSVNIYCTNN